jgi:hypothetical protein
MAIKIEAGKYYKDSEGNIRGPMVVYENSEYSFKHAFTDENGYQRYECFMEDGSYYRGKTPCHFDLIAEVDNGLLQQKGKPIVFDIPPKPLIGLTPQNIFLELQNKQRVQDILDACSRYNEANMDIPQEWIDELSSRRGVDVLDPKSEPHETEKPAYMKDFEYNGDVYSVVEDYGSCKECNFRDRGCNDANNTFENIAGVRCSTAPVSIHFVKKT